MFLTSRHYRQIVQGRILRDTEPIALDISRDDEDEHAIWVTSVDASPRRDVSSRRRWFGLRMRVPLAQVIHRAPAGAPTIQCDLLVGLRGAFETRSRSPVVFRRRGSFDDMQMLASSKAQQDSACLGFILGVLAKTVDCFQHFRLNQHPATDGKWIGC